MATGGTGTDDLLSPGNTSVEGTGSQPEVWSSASGEVYRSRVWEDLRGLFQQDQLTDVMLAADGQSIPCHKVLLAASSKFFHDKFITNPESMEHNLLDIEGVDIDTLISIVSFIYSGRIELTVEKTEKLIPASISLLLPELTNTCKEFLLHKVKHDITACVSVHRVATVLSQDDVRDEAWKMMLEKFILIAKSDSFKEMSESELLKYITDEWLHVANEDPVFEAVVSWVRHDLQNRKSRFESLLESITLSHCSYRFLGDFVRKEPLMKSVMCLERLAEALGGYYSLGSAHLGTPRRRFNVDTLIVVYSDRYWKLKAEESEWVSTRLRRIRNLRNSHACLAVDGILFTGGMFDNKVNQRAAVECWKLSLPALVEIEMSDLNVARHSHASVRVGNKVYVLGGAGDAMKSVECLEHKDASWQILGDITFPLYDHTAVNYNDLIYAFGGSSTDTEVEYQDRRFGSHRFFRETQACLTLQLDTQSGIWSKKADMPQDCIRGSSVVYRDRLYVLGGNTNCCMSYDPHQDQWKIHSGPNTYHEGASAVVWEDRILLCGGRITSVIEEYDPDTDIWSEWKYKLPETTDYPTVFAISS